MKFNKKFLLLLSFIPLFIRIIFILSFSNKGSIDWRINIPIIFLLLVTGISITSNKKFMEILSLISLIILIIVHLIVGYYDYIKWFSSIIGVILLIYFMFIKFFVKNNIIKQ